ncbi:hypothetical protein [Phenylobacterium sp.]|uniref:hypothetical protein n=1 Tax=Phenylobacterium sp. TaxID=1871053 RepID=UPI001229095D|nr:hypothetical protein [Phenylobacterium sp.]THD60180.1 MAG: hypothetical protein E8A49_14510 [Phenylobacterium sp.]
MPESAEAVALPKEAAGARPASQGAQLGALAKAQLAGALRLVSAEALPDVERYCDPVLVAAGKVSLFSLEALQKAFGGRWAARREEVFAFADALLTRSVGDRGAFRRVSDSDYFVVHSTLGELTGQAASLRYLREILIHFLGKADKAVQSVLKVTRFRKGRLETEPVDARRVEALAADLGPHAETDGPDWLAAFQETSDITTRLVDRSSPFVASDGRTLRITATLEPVYELKNFTRIGFRMIRRIIVVDTGEELSAKQIAALSTGDLLRADMATITRGIARLKAEDADEEQLSLIVPVSFSSLASPRGRAELVAPVREAAALVRLGVICEVHDIEGVPQSALQAVNALIRPLSLLVVGRLTQPTAAAFAKLGGAGFQAIAFECPHGAVSDAEFLGWAQAAVTAARRAAKSVLVYRAGTMKRAGALVSLGATHMSLDAG